MSSAERSTEELLAKARLISDIGRMLPRAVGVPVSSAERIPAPGQIWQHFKHTEATPHRYRIMCLTEPGPGPQDSPAYFTAEHTETGDWLDVLPAAGTDSCDFDDTRFWLFPAQPEGFVIYRAVGDRSGKCWARPLSNFLSPDARSSTGYRFWRVL